MSSFDDRERAHESKFAHDQHAAFKIRARRDKLFGLWAAEKLGKKGEETEAYAQSIIALDLEKHGIETALHKVEHDFLAAGVKLSHAALHAQLDKLHEAARKQVMSA